MRTGPRDIDDNSCKARRACPDDEPSRHARTAKIGCFLKLRELSILSIYQLLNVDEAMINFAQLTGRQYHLCVMEERER